MAVLLSSALYLSCDDIYDNVKEFSTKETVYPAHFDYISGQVGFERVEIDLSRLGRIPSSQMNLGKAKKTIVMYDREVIVRDSLCSWIEIRGLSTPKLYRFTIYTEDEFGNRSTPLEIALTPFTSIDRDALALISPTFLESTDIALVEWQNPVSNDLYDMFSYSYKYASQSGDTIRGSGEGDAPSFFLENVEWGKQVTVTVTSRVVPKVDKIPILDTITWSYPMVFVIEGTRKTVFLDKPAVGVQLDIEKSFPYALSWKKAEGVNDYSIKISTQTTFNPDETSIIHVGDVDSYELQAGDFTQALQSSYYGNAPLYWTVAPTNGDPQVLTQSRQFYVQRKVVKSYMMRLTNESERWTGHTYDPVENVYQIQTNGNNDNGNDPWVWTVGFTTDITEKALALAYEYKAFQSAVINPGTADWTTFNFQYFFSTPNADGNKTIAVDLPLIDNEWQDYSLELGTRPVMWGWGKAGHRFRLDPSDRRGLTLWLKNFRIDVYE
jgi:hypothetical protein